MVRRWDLFGGGFALLLFAARANAETVVTAGGTTATWTQSGSPYLVTARVTFEELTVEAGTIVRGAIGDSSRITVSRAFIVKGTRAEPAVFETIGAGSTTATWEGIWPATFNVAGAIFRHADAALFGGTTGATSRVSESRFEENNWAIELRGDLELNGVAFVGNNTAIFGESAGETYDVSVTNAALVGGQGIVALQPANVLVRSSTFSSVVNPVVSDRPASISNSILANAPFSNPGQGAVSVAHSSVWPSALPSHIVAGAGVVREDPRLVSATDLRLRPTSPCIDAATAADAPARDLDGRLRPIGLGFDRGAYEFSPVDAAGGEGGAGGTVGDAGASAEDGGEGGGAGTASVGGTAAGASGAAAGGIGAGASGASGPTAGGSSSGGDTSSAGASDPGGMAGGSKSSSACGCRVPGRERSRGEGATFVAMLAGLSLWRRRARMPHRLGRSGS